LIPFLPEYVMNVCLTGVCLVLPYMAEASSISLQEAGEIIECYVDIIINTYVPYGQCCYRFLNLHYVWGRLLISWFDLRCQSLGWFSLSPTMHHPSIA